MDTHPADAQLENHEGTASWPNPVRTPPVHHDASWQLQDAKARFSELVRLARTEGPQRVTVCGHDAVVVIAADAFERLLPSTTGAMPFVTFMKTLSVDGLGLTRDWDLRRDITL